MLLKLPCRFGEIFEIDQNSGKKEYMLTGFSHGIGENVDIDVTEFPTDEYRKISDLDEEKIMATLLLPDDLYDHQSSANFGLTRKVKGRMGSMTLKNGKAVFVFHPASSPAFPFYSESPVLEELLRPVLPRPLTEAERLAMPARALYTLQAHGRQDQFYARNGADLCTTFSVLRDVMPLFRLNRDSRYHMDIMGVLSDRLTPSAVPDQAALREAMRYLRLPQNIRAECKDILFNLKYHTVPKAPPLFQALYQKGAVLVKQFERTAACQLHVTVDLDRELVSFHWNPMCFAEQLPADLTVGIREGVECLERLADEIQDAGQLAAAMEAPLRRLESMARHPIRRADLRLDPDIMVGKDGFDVYMEYWDGYLERLGLELGPDDSVNIYGRYDPERGEATLSYITHYWDGRVGEETQVPLTIQERKLLLSEMNKACIRELDATMDEFWRQEQAPRHIPNPSGMALQ